VFWARAAWAKSIVHATPGLIVPWPSRSCRPKRPTIPNAAGVSIWKRARFPAFPTPISARCSVGHDSGVDYLVMEYLEGETLKERLKRGPLPVDHVLRIGAEIADALGKAHRGGIVHRDLKPANVMLTKSGAKLLDFGLARFCSRIETGSLAGDQTLTESERLTEPGAILGTWQYMAPEQLEARETDARTDIFALGALLFEMATARHAFPGKGRAAVIAAILSSEPPAISKLREASPTALDHVVKVCLAKEPDERWQNAYDVASQLKFISNAVQHPVLAQGGRRQTLKWIAASAALLLVGAVTGFLLLRSRSAGFTAHTMRFSIRPPDRTSFDVVVLSPDGRHLAFTADGTNEVRGLWVRSLDSEDFARVLGTEDASNPFWSPDSRSIAFFTKDKLKRVEAAGGSQPHCSGQRGRCLCQFFGFG
jgi:serine/threonine protein kinase